MRFFSAFFRIIALSVLTTPFPLMSSNPRNVILETNLTVSRKLSAPKCITSEDWITPRFLGRDCYTCIDELRDRETHKYIIPLEFVSYRTPPGPPSLWTQKTPRRYKYKSCTLAMVMLKDMPGRTPPGGYLGIDQTSYAQVELAAKEILARCISPVLRKGRGRRDGGFGFENPTGFDIIGRDFSIGIFLWDTGSKMNLDVPFAEAASVNLDMPLLAQPLNGTRGFDARPAIRLTGS